MNPKRFSVVFPPASPSRFGVRRRTAFSRRGLAPIPAPRDSDQEQEIAQIRSLVLRLASQLDASDRRIDAHLANIDRTLGELAVQKEQVRILERRLGIERHD